MASEKPDIVRQIEKGTPILVPVHAIGTKLRAVDFYQTDPDALYDIVISGDHTFLRQIADDNPDPARDHHAVMLRKAKSYATGLSIATFGNVWVEPVLLNEKLELMWQEPRVLSLVVDKEVDPGGPIEMQMTEYFLSKDVTGWIAAQYPQVSVFHHAGRFLLRSSLGYDYADYYHAEAVVAFYKIAEAVVARRRRLSPDLKHVQQEAAKLDCQTTAAEIKDLYECRGMAGAHGSKLVVVDRREAADAQLFADEIVIKDMLDRRKGGLGAGGPRPRPVRRCGSGT